MKQKTYTKTHRCEGLLKQKCSIRYSLKYSAYCDEVGWYLRSTIHDSEYGSTYLGSPIEVIYCPCCGEELL